MVSRTLLAVLLLAALAVERFMPTARQPSKEIAGVLLVVALAAYATSAAFLAAPAAPVPQALQIISRPWIYCQQGCFSSLRSRSEPFRKEKTAVRSTTIPCSSWLRSMLHATLPLRFPAIFWMAPFFLAN